MTSRCFSCLRYQGELTCQAFPKGIPEDIISGKVDHEKPIPGDGGKTYQPIPMSNFQTALQRAMEEKGGE